MMMLIKLFLISVLLTQSINCDCSNYVNNNDYIGATSRTAQGNECQFWSSQTPHRHEYGNSSYFRDGIKDAHNYCRNPKNDETQAWCYTTDPSVRWGYCNIPQCKGCSAFNGIKYMSHGIKNGKRYEDGSYIPGTVVEFECFLGAVYDEFSGPLNMKCDKFGKWTSYQLPKCLWRLKINDKPFSNCWYNYKDEKRLSTYAYYGQVAVTQDGVACQSWKKQQQYGEDQFGEEGISGAVNYCRAIENSKPWCYTDIDEDKWAYCDIPECFGCAYIPYVKYASYTTSNVTINNNENTIESGTVTYSCAAGSLIGSDTIRCINGEWAPAEPRCDIIFCSTNYPTVENSFLWRKKPIYASPEDFNKDRYMIDGSKIIYKTNIECLEEECDDKQVFVCENGAWVKERASAATTTTPTSDEQ